MTIPLLPAPAATPLLPRRANPPLLMLPSISTAKALQPGDTVYDGRKAVGIIEEINPQGYVRMQGKELFSLHRWAYQRITNAEYRFLAFKPPMVPGVRASFGASGTSGIADGVYGRDVVMRNSYGVTGTYHRSTLYTFHQLPRARMKTLRKRGIGINDAAYADIH